MKIVPIILSGGSGTRLWPVSRKAFPKQFHALIGENSMFQDTLLRLAGLSELGCPIIVANQEHRFLVAEQLLEKEMQGQIILEPIGRNTAPAVTLAAFEITRNFPEAIMVVLPSDHIVTDINAFHAALETAIVLAGKDKMVTFGVVPTRPETGYGYIMAGAELLPNSGAFNLERFVEKPNRVLAETYLQTGDYLWNSGMFVFKASVWLESMQTHASAMLESIRNAYNHIERDADFLRLEILSFSNCPSDSIDYTIMEKVTDGVVIKLDAGWSDVGSWDALAGCVVQDDNGNVTQGDVKLVDTTNSLIYSSSRFVAAVGLHDAIVVETADAILVTTKSNAQEVKSIVSELELHSRMEHLAHRAVKRPWGQYEGISKGERYQVKRITVKPGASLSLQMHYHRAEHWVVVRGAAAIVRGEEQTILTENQSTYIPPGMVHRLENIGKVDLELIEVQTGCYLGEDDIVRLEDRYGREKSP
jgi:mannose-1-phosphate guanylyltransferase / mannose-6-phosphate isomerase